MENTHQENEERVQDLEGDLPLEGEEQKAVTRNKYHLSRKIEIACSTGL
jgi:hypothetical protein